MLSRINADRVARLASDAGGVKNIVRATASVLTRLLARVPGWGIGRLDAGEQSGDSPVDAAVKQLLDQLAK